MRLHQNATTDKMYKLLFCKVLFLAGLGGLVHILCLNPLYIDSINSYQVSGMQIPVSCTTQSLKWHQLCSITQSDRSDISLPAIVLLHASPTLSKDLIQSEVTYI